MVLFLLIKINIEFLDGYYYIKFFFENYVLIVIIWFVLYLNL